MADDPNELKFDRDDSDVKFLVELGEDPFYTLQLAGRFSAIVLMISIYPTCIDIRFNLEILEFSSPAYNCILGLLLVISL